MNTTVEPADFPIQTLNLSAVAKRSIAAGVEPTAGPADCSSVIHMRITAPSAGASIAPSAIYLKP